MKPSNKTIQKRYSYSARGKSDFGESGIVKRDAIQKAKEYSAKSKAEKPISSKRGTSDGYMPRGNKSKVDEAGLDKKTGYNTLHLPNKELNKRYGYKKF
jgi:hypothetical protein